MVKKLTIIVLYSKKKAENFSDGRRMTIWKKL